MPNPALKNGYFSIANELAEQLGIINVPGNEMRIIWVVWRKTWAWKNGDRRKEWDKISLSQFEKATKMKRSNIVENIKSLVVKRILLKSEKGLKFNQNYNEWVVSKRLPPVCKSITSGMQKHNEGVCKSIHTKETLTKETYTKTTPTGEVEKILVRWLSSFQNIQNPSAYAATILKKYPAAHVRRALNDSLCTSPAQLSMLLEYYKKSAE